MAPVPVEAWAPAFGVRAAVKDNLVRLQVQDSGGRGHPHVVVVIRVKQEQDRLRLVDEEGSLITNIDAQGLQAACIYQEFNSDQTVSPYLFRIPVEKWPKNVSTVLVLLLYLQTRG